MKRIIASMGLAMSLVACQSNDAPVPQVNVTPNAPYLAYGRTAEVDVPAAKEWQSAGVRLRPGTAYRLTATGTWNIGPFCGITDANGTGVSPLCSTDHANIGAPGSSLIGRIGPTGKPFLVGVDKTLTPDSEGELFLRAYDLLPGDNVGTMTVKIVQRDSAQASGEPVPAHRDPI